MVPSSRRIESRDTDVPLVEDEEASDDCVDDRECDRRLVLLLDRLNRCDLGFPLCRGRDDFLDLRLRDLVDRRDECFDGLDLLSSASSLTCGVDHWPSSGRLVQRSIGRFVTALLVSVLIG